ncbi:RNA-directed DNA polymerase, eukaryota, partial [Tanacetum coccineum]
MDICILHLSVRYKSDRYGSNFNAHDAEIFNSFIYNAGLDEVPLGGSAYTWCLKSASKMSKLDRFFISENLLSMCPNITDITLERFISDHRPILLRELRYDYGPIPFRFYRYCLEVDGFDKLVRDSWNVAPVNKKNAIRNFMGKLKFLKDRIRSWLSIHRSNSRGEIYFKIVFRGKVYWVRASEVLGWTPEFSEEDEEDELSVEDNNDGRINDLEANNGIDESDVEDVLE